MDRTSQHLPDSTQTGKPRLLLLTHEYPHPMGDSCFLQEEVRALAERFQVTLLPLSAPDAPFGPVPEGVELVQGYRPPSRAQVIPYYLKAYASAAVKAEIQDARGNPRSSDLERIPREARYRWAYSRYMADRLAALIGNQEFDLLYSFWMHTEVLALLDIAQRQEERSGYRPVVISRTHGYDLYEERVPYGRQLFKGREAQELDGIFFACKAAKEYFEATWGLDGLDSGVFYLGTVSEERVLQPKPSDNRLTLVSCSNSVAIKRIDAIIQALSRIDSLAPDLSLDWHHIGDGAEQARLEQMAQALLGDKDRVSWTFHGYVPNDSLKDLYRVLEPDLFITTTSTEGGVPVSLQEAFSLGIPAVATAVGGIPEIVQEGQTGFLLASDENADRLTDELAQALARFAALPLEERQRLAKNALALQRETFDSRANAGLFSQHLLDLAEGRSTNPGEGGRR